MLYLRNVFTFLFFFWRLGRTTMPTILEPPTYWNNANILACLVNFCNKADENFKIELLQIQYTNHLDLGYEKRVNRPIESSACLIEQKPEK